MSAIFRLALLALFITTSNSSILSNVKHTLTTYIKNFRDSLDHSETPQKQQTNQGTDKSRFDIKRYDVDKGEEPKALIRIFKARDDKDNWRDKGVRVLGSRKVLPSKNVISIINRGKEPYRLDPVLNSLWRENIRRKMKDSEASDSSSSSMELRDWKTEWKEHWIKKKLEAINSTDPQGDVVNMVAARPWGVPCGDPNQHDMPWGSCMLPMECDSEYRIYRGDYACGRTQFVCCSIDNNNYDMNQAFDASFTDSGLTTDSDEKKNGEKSSAVSKRKKKLRDKQRRKNKRSKRKKEIKKYIKKIIKDIRNILNQQYTNGTSQKKRKTKQLKRFVNDLKKKYKKDQKAVKNIHEIELVKVDAALKAKLEEIKTLNKNFISNATFRDIIVKGKISRSGARMLIQAYPELMPFFADTTRKSGTLPKDYLDYDVEYGMLYY